VHSFADSSVQGSSLDHGERPNEATKALLQAFSAAVRLPSPQLQTMVPKLKRALFPPLALAALFVGFLAWESKGNIELVEDPDQNLLIIVKDGVVYKIRCPSRAVLVRTRPRSGHPASPRDSGLISSVTDVLHWEETQEA
jgi:hypothetical protein